LHSTSSIASSLTTDLNEEKKDHRKNTRYRLFANIVKARAAKAWPPSFYLEEQRDCTEELLSSEGLFPLQMLLNLKEARSRILAFPPAFLTTTFSEKPRIQF
jgi:hypothetical protein